MVFATPFWVSQAKKSVSHGWNGFIQSLNKLQIIKPTIETAVYESTHGGVRGRGSNPPTYSIF
jgi:hypothetical protein